jgi:hypothetical protein
MAQLGDKKRRGIGLEDNLLEYRLFEDKDLSGVSLKHFRAKSLPSFLGDNINTTITPYSLLYP